MFSCLKKKHVLPSKNNFFTVLLKKTAKMFGGYK